MVEKSYILLGHGFEDMDSERQQIPEGVTLVTMSECGVKIIDKDVYEIFDYLKEHPLTNPKNIHISKPLRIYKYPDEIPTLFISFFLDFLFKDGRVGVEKSGVYPVPLPFSDLPVGYINKTNIYGNNYVNNSTGIIDKIYSGSVFPPESWLTKIKTDYNQIPETILKKDFSLTDIFKYFDNKGTFYFSSCRSIPFRGNLGKYLESVPKNITNTHNTVKIAEYMLKMKVDIKPRNRKFLERTIFSVKQIRPRSAKRRSGDRKSTRRRSHSKNTS